MTAVEWLEETSKRRNLVPEDFEQAKAMHKEEIMQAVYNSMGTNIDPNMRMAELYYNTTFKLK